MTGKPKLMNLSYAGRVLETDSGRVEETLTAHDVVQRMFSYRTSDSLPFYIRKVSTMWSITRTTDGYTRISVIQNLYGVFPFKVLVWFARRGYRKKLSKQLDELKNYLTTS